MGWTFHAVNVHSALTPQQIASEVLPIMQLAKRIKEMGQLLDCDRHRQATLCIFFDEVNTSSCMGIFKELLIDHSLDGELLPENIVVIAACNPARDKIKLTDDRRQELGNEWVIGHYQVHPLPDSMQLLAWDYGSLKPAQEKEFIEKRLLLCVPPIPDEQAGTFANLISMSQQITREFAQEHIASLVTGYNGSIDASELAARASSSSSLRDILRTFRLFAFFASRDSSDPFLTGSQNYQRTESRGSKSASLPQRAFVI